MGRVLTVSSVLGVLGVISAFGLFWKRPWPNWRLIVASEATQVIGTLAAVYGWGVMPLGWKYAFAVWGYALAWFFVNDLVKVEAHRLLNLGTQRHQRHLARVNASLHPDASVKAGDASA